MARREARAGGDRGTHRRAQADGRRRIHLRREAPRLTVRLSLRIASEVWLEQLGSVAQAVELVRPELHHRNQLVPIFTARIGPAHAVALELGELALDRVWLEPPALLDPGRRPARTIVVLGLC